MKRKKELHKKQGLLKITCIIIICLLFGCNSTSGKKEFTKTNFKPAKEHYIQVGFSNLIANPTIYNHRLIRVRGFLQLGFEVNSLYVSREDFVNNPNSKSIWINISRKQMNSIYSIYNKKDVAIEGFFDIGKKGHMNMHHGTITNINKIEEQYIK